MSYRTQNSTLIKRTVLFTVILAGVIIVLNSAFYKIVARIDPFLIRDAQFAQVNEPIKYLVLGHSRGKTAINDSIVEGAFNYASGGEHSCDTYYKLKYILEETDKEVEYIIVPNGIGSVFSAVWIVGQQKGYYWKKYYDYVEFGREKGELKETLTGWLKLELFPYSQFIKETIDRKYLSSDKNVIAYPEMTEEQRNEAALELVNRYVTIADNPEDIKEHLKLNVAFSYMEKIVDLCRKHGVKMIYIQYPITPELQIISEERFTAHHLDFSEVNEYLEAQEDILLLDYHDMYYDHQEYFHDMHHMNRQGRQAFSLFFQEEVIQLGL